MASSEDHHESFVRLFSKHEGNVRAFVTSLLPRGARTRRGI